MTREFYEGPAGSGKTHKVIERTRELVSAGLLNGGQRVLALTFMNGARKRLESSLAKHAELRRKFECKTVDVFAHIVASRRRTQLAVCAEQVEAASKLDRFDGPCHLAAHLLQSPHVSRWVAASYPLVLVDEAQDLDEYRLPILQGLSSACSVLAAADEFQCLDDDPNTAPVIAWLKSFGTCLAFDGSRRTSQPGILKVAQAVRNGTNLLEQLTKKNPNRSTWSAPGFKLTVVSAKNTGFPAWTVANELSQFKGNVAILTPDTGSSIVRDALDMVCTRIWKRSNSDVTFGPFAIEWDVREHDRAQDLSKLLELPALCGIEHMSEGNAKALRDPALVRVRQRMQRAMRVHGEHTFSNERVNEMIGDAVRDVARFSDRRGALRTAMSIHRAKNREFRNVIVLWPYSATGTDAYLRRLLYNAITRAQDKCTVVVLGKEDRLNRAPFGCATEQVAGGTTKRKRRPKPPP